MANTLFFFMAPEDEVAFFRMLEKHVLDVYPRRVPPDYQGFRATAAAHPDLPEDDLYLVASDIGAAEVDKVKRGPDKGSWRIDEVRSPVIYMQRSRLNEDGELLSGKLWAELDITPQTGRKSGAQDRFRSLFLEIESWVKKTYRKSDPKEFWIGPRVARHVKEEQLVLRIDVHRGGTVGLHRGR